MHVGQVIISQTIFKQDNTDHQKSYWARNGVPVLTFGVWQLWCVYSSLLLGLYIDFFSGLRTHHRRLPLRPSIRHQIRQRRRPHRADHRAPRPLPQVHVYIGEMVTRNFQSERRTSQHPPITTLGPPGRAEREIPFQRG